MALVKYFNTWLISVLVSSGWKSISSRMIYKICFFPFWGGINFSILSEKNTTPILSLFCIAEKAKVAAISVITSFFMTLTEPKSRLPDTSISSITVSSRSSSNTLT